MRGGAVERGRRGAESVHGPFGDFLFLRGGGGGVRGRLSKVRYLYRQKNTEKPPEMLDGREVLFYP